MTWTGTRGDSHSKNHRIIGLPRLEETYSKCCSAVLRCFPQQVSSKPQFDSLSVWEKRKTRFVNFNKSPPYLNLLHQDCSPFSALQLPSLSDLHGNGCLWPRVQRGICTDAWLLACPWGRGAGGQGSAPAPCPQQGEPLCLVQAKALGKGAWGVPRPPSAPVCVGRVDGTSLPAGPLELGT